MTNESPSSNQRRYPPKHSAEVNAVVSELIKVAAELARGIADEPVIPDTAARYVRERAAKAVDDANERAKVIALRIRYAVDKLPSTADEPPAAQCECPAPGTSNSSWSPFCGVHAPPPPAAPCGCRETYPQLQPGRVNHGPGCSHTVPQSVYESAVRGRRDFREAYRQARDLLNRFVAAWEKGGENMDRLCELARNFAPSDDEPSGVGINPGNRSDTSELDGRLPADERDPVRGAENHGPLPSGSADDRTGSEATAISGDRPASDDVPAMHEEGAVEIGVHDGIDRASRLFEPPSGVLVGALQQIFKGPPTGMDNSEVAAWAGWIAAHALGMDRAALTKNERCQCGAQLPPLAQWSMPSCPLCVEKAEDAGEKEGSRD